MQKNTATNNYEIGLYFVKKDRGQKLFFLCFL